MPRKSGKENYSISVDPKSMDALQKIADRHYFGNRSVAAEKAIWDFVFSTLAEDPDCRDLICDKLDIKAN